MNKIVLTGIWLPSMLVGCGTAENQPTTSPSPTDTSATAIAPTTPSPTPTPTPTPSPSPSPSPTAWQSFPPADPTETKDQAAIRAGWEEHERQLDRFMKDLTLSDWTPLTLTTSGQEKTAVVHFIGDLRDKGHIREGDMTFRDVRIEDPDTSSDGTRMASMSVCADYSNTRFIVAATGELVQPEEGGEWVETLRVSYTMVEQPNGLWVVSESYAERKTC